MMRNKAAAVLAAIAGSSSASIAITAPESSSRRISPMVIVLAGPPAFSLEGNLVIIDHGMGLGSAFLHLATTNVQVGQQVRQGQFIGTVGATGRARGLTFTGA